MQAEAGKMPEERHPGLGSRLGASKEPIGVETPIGPWTSGSGNAYGYVSIRLCSTIKKRRIRITTQLINTIRHKKVTFIRSLS